MARPLRTSTARRLRTATAVTAILLASTACGLQRAGVDGIVTAEGAAAPAAVAGAPGVGAPQAGPGVVGGGTTGGLAAGTSGATGGVVGGSGGTSGGAIAGGSTGSGTTGGTGGTTGAGTSGAALPPQSSGLKGELTVSYINVSGFDQLGKVVVIRTASTGNAREQANALAAHVNANGGIAGRKLIPKVHDYSAQQASEVNDNNLCQQITQTDKAFMAVLHGQIHASARDCYAARKTLAFEGSSYGWGKAFYKEHDPYLWSPSYADYDQASRALVTRIKESKWLAGETKVGVILWDDKPYHDVVDKTLAPGLKGLGVDVVKAAISNSDIGSIENGIHAAAQTMVASGVDHLTFVGSSPLQPFFVQQNQQNRQFVYALTSFDVPRYMSAEFPNNMVGMVGVGFSPVEDVYDEQLPFPQPGLEAECRAIYKKYGVDVPGRYLVGEYNSKQAMSYCESTLLLKKAADAVKGELTGAAWTAVANTLGTSFQAAQTFRTSFGPDKHTGSTVFRDIAFKAECKCMVYTSGNRQLS